MSLKKFVFFGLLLVMAFVLAGCEDLTTAAPTTAAPTTAAPTTVAPTTAAPTTVAPTTVAPTTVAPTTAMSDEDFVQAFLDAIDLGDLTAVTEDLTLTGSVMGITVAWTTTDPDVVTNLGEITVPQYGQGDATATLRVTATLREAVLYRDFVVVVAEESATSFLNRLGAMIIINSSDNITVDFNLPAALQGATITWESSHPLIATVATEVVAGNYKITITRPVIGDGGADTTVTLTATLEIGDAEVEVEKTIRVIAVEEEIVQITIAEARTKAIDEQVLIEGIVTVAGGTQIFIQDETAGMYIYYIPVGVYSDPIVAGDKLLILGEIDIYSQSVQMNPAQQVTLVSSGNPIPEPVAMDELDLAAVMTNHGKTISIPNLVIKELVVPTADATSFGFKVTDGVSDLEIRVDKYTANYAAIKTYLNTLIVGDSVNIVGMGVGRYNANAQLSMMNTAQIVKMTNAEKLAADVAALAIDLEVASGLTVELPLIGAYGSTIVWDVATAIPTATYSAVTGELTYPDVVVATDYTLTATISMTGESDQTKPFTVNVLPMTDAAKLAADVEEAALELTADELDEVTLPATGTYGTAITWEVLSGDAVIETGVLKFAYKGEAYVVEVKASFSFAVSGGDPLTDEETYTINVSPLTVVSDLHSLSTKTGGVWDVAAGEIYVRGIVSGLNGTSGAFIQDENGYSMYLRGLKTQVVGDEVIAKGTLGEYNAARQVDGTTLVLLVSSENAVVKTPMTIAELEAITFANAPAYASMLVTLEAGLKIKEFRGNYVDFYWYLDGSTQYVLSMYYNNSTYNWLDDIYAAESTLPAIEFTFYNFYVAGNAFNITNLVIERTADQDVTLDKAKLPATLELTGDYLVPDPSYGSTYTVTAVSSELTAYIDYTTTPGTLDVTQPLDADKVGTVTITVSKDGATSQELVIAVTVKMLVEGVTLEYVIDFGSVYDQGYDEGTIVFTNNFDSLEYALPTTRAQSNTSTYEPHVDMGPFGVMAPKSGALVSFIEFDFSTEVDPIVTVSFEYSTWSGTAYTNINDGAQLVNPVLVLQVYNTVTETWDNLENDDEVTNLIPTLSSTEYKTSEYTITTGSRFRVYYTFDSATSTSNTAYAVTIDNFKVWVD